MSPTPEAASNDKSKADIKDLINEIGGEVAAFQAKDLAKLKGELEAFEKKRAQVVDGYRLKYPILLERWEKLNEPLKFLHGQLKEKFGKEAWHDHFKSCVCDKRKTISDLQTKLDKRATSVSGELGHARDIAKAASDEAKNDLDSLIDNVTRIETTLSENEKSVSDIRTLLEAPKGSAVAVYLLWGKLLPSHRRLRPQSVGDCLKFAEDESMEKLCEETSPASSRRPAPWLISPDSYENEIYAAWNRYRQSKDALGSAEDKYSVDPDDFESQKKRLDALRKSFDDDVRCCLASIKVEKPTCGGAPAPQTTEKPDTAPANDQEE
ncbi:hypothetical protein GCM10027431_26550 [Lysobacter rhizosphaerae]